MDQLPDQPAPRKRSGMRTVLLWVGIPIAVLIAIPLAVEAWRQNEHRAARAELKAELVAFDARFEGQDVDAWYRARVPANDGSAAMRAVAAAWSSRNGAEALAWSSILLNGIEYELLEPGPETEGKARAILEFTQPAHDGLLGLTRFEALWCVPEPHDEVYVATSMLPAVPRQRAAALMALGRHDEAREAIVVAQEIASRLRYPANFEHAVDALDAATAACDLLLEHAEETRFPSQQAQRLLDAAKPWPDLRQWVAQGEAAHIARLWRSISGRDDWDEVFMISDGGGLFAWVTFDNSTGVNLDKFFSAARDTRARAEHLRNWRAAIDRNGAEPTEGEDPLSEVAWRVEQLNKLLLQVRAVATLRLAHAGGTPWDQLTLEPAAFPGLALFRDGEAIILREPADPDAELEVNPESDDGEAWEPWGIRLLP